MDQHEPTSSERTLMEKTITWFDRFFSFVVFLVILLLAAYTLIALWIGSQEIFATLFEGAEAERRQLRMLHAVARTIVVLKAYRILVSYLRSHHVTVRYILEIAIIASVVELFFAYDLHHVETLIVFATFGLVGLALYLYFYEGRNSERPADH